MAPATIPPSSIGKNTLGRFSEAGADVDAVDAVDAEVVTGLAASGFLSASLVISPVSTFCCVSGVTADFVVSAGFDDCAGFAGSVFGAAAAFGVSVGVLVTGSDLALAAFGVVASGLDAADGCAVSDGFCAAGLAVDFAAVFDFAADEAREVDVCFGLSLPLLGVFAFATLKTFPILAAYKPFL